MSRPPVVCSRQAASSSSIEASAASTSSTSVPRWLRASADLVRRGRERPVDRRARCASALPRVLDQRPDAVEVDRVAARPPAPTDDPARPAAGEPQRERRRRPSGRARRARGCRRAGTGASPGHWSALAKTAMPASALAVRRSPRPASLSASRRFSCWFLASSVVADVLAGRVVRVERDREVALLARAAPACRRRGRRCPRAAGRCRSASCSSSSSKVKPFFVVSSNISARASSTAS